MISKNQKFLIKKEPFPYIVIENFLEKNFYNNLEKDFPNIEDFKKSNRSVRRMNYDSSYGDDLYNGLIKRSIFFKKFHEYVYSQTFIKYFYNLFKDDIYKELKNKTLLDDLSRFQIDSQPYEIGKIIGKKDLKQNTDKFLYPRLDIGVGIEKYGEKNGGGGIHIDNPQRLISILFYVGGYTKIEGGEHRIWKTNNDKTNLKIFEEIKPKSNLLIAALQNNDAYHDVNPITLINGTRNAFYMAISSNVPIWKKVRRNKFNLRFNRNRVELSFLQKIFSYFN